MLQKLLAYIRFLQYSTNAHDVHSPFVYEFVTSCLYNKPHYKGSKSVQILLKCIHYFAPTSLCVPNELKDTIQHQYSTVQFQVQNKAALLFYNCPLDVTLNNLNIHPNTIVIIKNIHKNKASIKAWKQLKNQEIVHQTINLFHTGILLFRPKQAKEHFNIRF